MEREAAREIAEAMRDAGKVAATSAAERRALRERAVIARRDAIERAGDYPLTERELAEACHLAAIGAKVPEEWRDDTAQDLAEYVQRRHGMTPTRAKVARSGLQKLASTLYLAERRKRERALGMRAAAEQLSEWQRKDRRSAKAAAIAEAARGGDAIRALAAGMPAPTEPKPVSARWIAERLPLSPGQREALRAALTERERIRRGFRPRASAGMTGAQRAQWAEARRILRERYPEPARLLLCIRGETWAAEQLVNAAIRAERSRAAIASRGSGSTARSIPPASGLPLRRFARPPIGKPEPLAVIGQTEWSSYGNGYSGACSIAHIYRGRSRPRGNMG